MPATVFFQDGSGSDVANLQMNFLASGSPADPTTVTCVITDPTGNQTVHTVGAGPPPADITKVSIGVYTLNIGSTIVGLWGYVWIGSGSNSEVEAGTWTVGPASTLNQLYTSVEELKDRLKITDTQDDFILQAAVQAAARAIEHVTGRFFYQLTETRTFRPYSIWEQPIDDLVSITQLAVDNNGFGVFDTIWTSGVDYELLVDIDQFNPMASGEKRPYTLIRVINAAGGGKFFPFVWPFSRLDRIQIQGTWGWPQVPYAIRQATQQTAAEFYKLKDTPFGLAGTSEFGLVRVPRQNPYIMRLLSDYIHPKRAVGV